MSSFDDVFRELRIEHGLKHKPNWSGTVYGVCRTKGCPNYRKIGYYEGGFCKKCSTRHPDDTRLPVLSGINLRGTMVSIPNPKIRWITKRWVIDLSEKLSPEEKRIFYMTPEERQRTMDRIDYKEKEDEEIDD